MIKISGVFEAYWNDENCDLGYITSDNNPADVYTKVKNCDALNQIVLRLNAF